MRARAGHRSVLRRHLPVIASVGALLGVPLGFGVGLGWYGLDPIMAERTGPVGSDAHELLNSFPDSSLIVEITAPVGELPAPDSISTLWDRMNSTLSKSSISFHLETYTQSSSGALGTNELFDLESQVRHSWPEPGTMALCYLFVDGSFAGSPSVLGLAYAASSIAVFPRVSATSGGSPLTGAVLSTVLVHEFGHELGLVGLVGSAPNEDPSHPGHSADSNDVMYWQVETTAVLGGVFGASPPTQFDAADRSDLDTVRGTPILLEIIPWVVLATVLVASAIVVVRWRRRPGDIGPS
ncbi:MAG TPA: hypothetical protein VIZ68_07905 [Thermoplasmata archaeon]